MDRWLCVLDKCSNSFSHSCGQIDDKTQIRKGRVCGTCSPWGHHGCRVWGRYLCYICRQQNEKEIDTGAHLLLCMCVVMYTCP